MVGVGQPRQPPLRLFEQVAVQHPARRVALVEVEGTTHQNIELARHLRAERGRQRRQLQRVGREVVAQTLKSKPSMRLTFLNGVVPVVSWESRTFISTEFCSEKLS